MKKITSEHEEAVCNLAIMSCVNSTIESLTEMIEELPEGFNSTKVKLNELIETFNNDTNKVRDKYVEL